MQVTLEKKLKDKLLTSAETIDHYLNASDSLNLRLTKRELQVLKILLAGKSAKGIAGVLQLSPRTIENHIDKIKLKLGCKKQSQLISKLHHLIYEDILGRNLYSESSE